MRALLPVFLLAATLGVPAAGSLHADDASVARGERAAVRAVLSGSRDEPSQGGLERLRADGDLEPWLVVDALRTLASVKAAERYVALLQPEDRPALEAYLRDVRVAPRSAISEVAESAARQAVDASDWTGGARACRVALANIDEACASTVYLRLVLAAFLAEVVLLGEALASCERAAADAESIGWRAAAVEALATIEARGVPAGHYRIAARAAERLYALCEARRDADGLADQSALRAGIAEAMGDFGTALRWYEEAVSLYERLGRSADAIEARIDRSQCMAAAGMLRAALEEQSLLQQLLARSEGADLRARNRRALATIYWYLGDAQRGREALGDPASGDAEAADPLGAGARIGTRALLHALDGQFEQALADDARALALFVGAGEAAQAAVARANMANVLSRWVEHDRASAPHEPKEQRGVAGTAELKRLEDARRLAEDAIAVFKASSMDSDRLGAQETLGRVLLALQRRDEARSLLDSVAQEAELLGDWKSAVEARAALATLSSGEQAWKEAVGQARAGLRMLSEAQSGLASGDRAGAFSQRADLFELGVAAASRQGDLAEAHVFLERGRAAALLSGLGGRAAALRAGVAKGTEQKLKERTAEKLRRIGLYYAARQAGGRGPVALWEDYKTAQREEEVALREVAREEERVAERLAPARPRSIAEIRARLKEVESDGLPTTFVSFSLQPRDLFALVLRAEDAKLIHYEARATHAIQGALATLVEALSARLPSGAHAGSFVRVPLQMLETLRRELIGPLGLAQGRQRLLVSPDRELAFLPFALLVGPETNVALEPSATTWALLLEKRLLRGTGTLALGNPDYGAVRDRDVFASRGGPRLVPLPHSVAEVSAITPRKDLDHALLGRQATEVGLRQALVGRAAHPRWRCLHLACHGLVDSEWPALSSLAITPGDGEDGFLTSAEVLTLPIEADLAVLSACQTGRGRILRGEGAMSLARAFMHAGAPRVLVSLWDVDDAATAFLMTRFHELWRAGKTGAAEALRLAQQATREHQFEGPVSVEGKPQRQETRTWWADPDYWAAWVLWGLAD